MYIQVLYNTEIRLNHMRDGRPDALAPLKTCNYLQYIQNHPVQKQMQAQTQTAGGCCCFTGE